MRECRALDGCLLALPIHPNWESYSTVPAGYNPSAGYPPSSSPGPGPTRSNGTARTDAAAAAGATAGAAAGAEPVSPVTPDARFVTTRAFVRAVGG